jgi:hypothetical protein
MKSNFFLALKQKMLVAIATLACPVLTIASEATAASLNNVNIKVTVESLEQPGGSIPVAPWITFHDGSFDIYDPGKDAFFALERSAENADITLSSDARRGLEFMAEEGRATFLAQAFNEIGAGLRQTQIFSNTQTQEPILKPPAPFNQNPFGSFYPGDIGSMVFELDPSNSKNQCFSYVHMVVPSNDAFVGNDNPREHCLFDDNGNFTGEKEITVFHRDIWDAGTEINTESNDDNAPGARGVGESSGGLTYPDPVNPFQYLTVGAGYENNPAESIAPHPGYLDRSIPDGTVLEDGRVIRNTTQTPGGNILGNPVFYNADFVQTPDTPFYRISIEQVSDDLEETKSVPEPATNIALLFFSGLLLFRCRVSLNNR